MTSTNSFFIHHLVDDYIINNPDGYKFILETIKLNEHYAYDFAFHSLDNFLELKHKLHLKELFYEFVTQAYIFHINQEKIFIDTGHTSIEAREFAQQELLQLYESIQDDIDQIFNI